MASIVLDAIGFSSDSYSFPMSPAGPTATQPQREREPGERAISCTEQILLLNGLEHHRHPGEPGHPPANFGRNADCLTRAV